MPAKGYVAMSAAPAAVASHRRLETFVKVSRRQVRPTERNDRGINIDILLEADYIGPMLF